MLIEEIESQECKMLEELEEVLGRPIVLKMEPNFHLEQFEVTAKARG
jgi:hypothetical protein